MTRRLLPLTLLSLLLTDAAGDTYTYGYSGSDTKVTSLTEPDGRQIQFTYGTYKDKPVIASMSIAGLSSSTITYTYSEQANGQLYVEVTETKDSDDRVTRYVFENTDSPATGHYYGTLLLLVEDCGDASHLNATQAWVYNSNHKVIKYRDSYQTESGGTPAPKEHRHWFYYEDTALPFHCTKFIDGENADANPPTGNCPAYHFEYDNGQHSGYGNLTKITTPEERELQISYVSGSHRPSAITLIDRDINDNPANHTWQFSWYGSGAGYLLESITDPRSNTTNFSYDTSKWYLDYIDPPLGNNIDVATNDVGDITAVTDGNGNTTSFQWDGIHRLTQITYPSVGAGSKSVLLDWRCCGLEQITDENGIVTKAEYDPYTHWLKKITEDYGGTGHLNYLTEATYDEVGNLKTVKNARGKTTSYSYDGADRLIRTDYPDSTYETWSYRDDGRVYQHRDGRGRVASYRYDADDRLAGSGSYVAIDYPNDTDVQIARDDDGLVTSFTDGTGTTSMDYYPSGWLKTLTNGASKTVTYQYNGVGLLSTLTTPGDLDFDYSYNANNQVSAITAPGDLSFSFEYDNGGRRTKVNRPGSYIQYQYNARNWITAVRNRTTGGSTRYDAEYYYQDGSLWDHTGNPLLRKEYWAGTSAYPTTLRYDHLYRMTEETKRDPSSNVLYSLAYGYDAVGNRTSMTRDGISYSYSYDDNDKLSAVSGNEQSASLSYDGAGNLTSVSGSLFGCWTLVYDDESRLTSVTYPEGEGSQTDSYWYNALGQRMRHHFSGGYRRYLYAGERVVEVTNDAGNDVRARYTLEGESYYQPLVHLWFAGDGDRFPAYDGSGTARRLLNDEGGAAVTWYLDAFGRYLSGSGSGSTKYRYGGAWGYMTDPSGLLQLGARFYWPEIGRFVQQDPIGDGMNWYAYAGNNPVVYVDPEGLHETTSILHNIIHGDGHSLQMAGQGLAAWVDGFIPFADPLRQHYDPCDPAFQASRAMGGATRSTMISAGGAPNLPAWLRNPRLYELGQRALPDSVYEPLARLSPIARGARLAAMAGIPRPGIGTYARLVPTGLTPPGWPVAAAALHGADYAAPHYWSYVTTGEW